MAMGRPIKYKPEFCKTVIALMKDGASKIEVCAELGICYDTLLDWCNDKSDRYKEDFSESIKMGTLLSQAWWEKEGRVGLKDKDLNSTLWFMNMKNRFRKSPVPWADKTEQEVSANISGGGKWIVEEVRVEDKKEK